VLKKIKKYLRRQKTELIIVNFSLFNKKMTKKLLELFSGTHSFGKVAEKKRFEVISLDRDLSAKCPFSDYISPTHIKADIMTWNYKIYEPGHFDIITASPVCTFWSNLRKSWIGRASPSITGNKTELVTQKHLDNDIEKYGKPMVDKVIEIIEYFKPKYWLIENPQTGSMKNYIKDEYPNYNTFYDVDYCKYSNWGYQKRTRFWTNVKDFKPQTCKCDCNNIVIFNNQKFHRSNLGSRDPIIDNGKLIRLNTKKLREKYKDYEKVTEINYENTICNITNSNNKLKKYRIPEKLIEEIFDLMV